MKNFFSGAVDKPTAIVIALEKLGVIGRLLDDDRFYLNGSKPCIADFVLFEHINFVNHLTDATYTWYPKLEAFHNRMKNSTNMKKYLSGPHHAKTSNNWLPKMAKINFNVEKVKLPGKLYYFEVDGRAGGIRAMLAHANVNFIDARQSFPDFNQLKASGFLPLGSMPVWEEDGFKMCQSSAILRMLGLRYGYYSNDSMTAWAIDSLVDFMEDL